VLVAEDGSAGNTLIGGPDRDAVFGGDGDDVLAGGPGSDELAPGHGDDIVRGGDDADTVSYATAAEPPSTVRIDLAAGIATGIGTDSLTSIENAVGAQIDDVLIGTDGDNVLRGRGVIVGNGGSDTLSGSGTFEGGTGGDVVCPCDVHDGSLDSTVDGGMDQDLLVFGLSPYPRYSARFSPVTVVMDGQGQTPHGSLGVTNVEEVLGTGGADTLIGDDGPNVFRAFDGADVIEGRGGDDEIFGGTGTNTLTGGTGDDELRTGQGDGTVDGGPGFDRYSVARCCGPVVIDLLAGTLTRAGAVFTFVGVESVTGSSENDTLLGSQGADVLIGWIGDDTLIGHGGDDVLRGGDGVDDGDGGPGSDRCVSVEVPTACEELRPRS
jgi:Ca2+-binding RTX toxin-like protein